MSVDLEVIQREGRYWWVSVDLVGNNTAIDLVVPSPLRRGPVDASNQRFAETRGLAILGFAYNYVAGAASVGFDLTSVDDTFTDGTTRNFNIWSARSQAAGLVSQTVNDTLIPLSKAEVISTPANGATLRVTNTSTGPTAGCLLIWGIETSDSWTDQTSGSPFAFPST